MEPIKKTSAFLCVLLLATGSIAGCFGDGFGASGAPHAVVFVSGVGEDEYTFRFDASGSTGSSLSYAWDLGDGTTASDAVVEHTYSYGDGIYTARLVIEDDAGTPDVWEDEITVGTGENRPPVALFSPGPRNYGVDEPVTVDASASFDPEGDPVRYQWDFNHLMDYGQYMEFREEKARALDQMDDKENFEVTTGNPGPGQTPLVRIGLTGPKSDGASGPQNDGSLHRSACLGPCPEDGGTTQIQPSLFSHTVETDEPVYTLEDGFPDATVFFIRLQVFDIKGAHESILSEEIWPVEVFNNPPQDEVRDSTSDTFAFGAPEPVTDLLNDLDIGDDEFQYDYTWEFTLDWPVAPSKRDGIDIIPGGQITVRWQDPNATIDMTVTPPNGEELSSYELEHGHGKRVELNGNNDYVEGNWQTPWKVYIIARSGVNIEWELDYWMNLDTNPFGSMEEEYV